MYLKNIQLSQICQHTLLAKRVKLRCLFCVRARECHVKKLHLLAFMLPCVQPFMSGEDWKEVLPWACCIMGLWAWPNLGDMRGL